MTLGVSDPVRLGEPRRRPDPDSVDVAVEALQCQLDRYLAGLDALDQKSALLPAALAAVGALGLVPVSGERATTLSVFLAFTTLSGALVAFLLSLSALAAQRLHYGADPVDLALGTSLPVGEFRQGLANSLARTIVRAEQVGATKGTRLNLSFFAAIVSVVSLLAFRLLSGVTV